MTLFRRATGLDTGAAEFSRLVAGLCAGLGVEVRGVLAARCGRRLLSAAAAKSGATPTAAGARARGGCATRRGAPPGIDW